MQGRSFRHNEVSLFSDLTEPDRLWYKIPAKGFLVSVSRFYVCKNIFCLRIGFVMAWKKSL